MYSKPSEPSVMLSFNCSSSLETQITLQHLPLQTACTIFSSYFQQNDYCLFVLAVCETSYARGLKQMQLATD